MMPINHNQLDTFISEEKPDTVNLHGEKMFLIYHSYTIANNHLQVTVIDLSHRTALYIKWQNSRALRSSCPAFLIARGSYSHIWSFAKYKAEVM